MKKLILLAAIFQLSFAFSQCTISGAAQLQVGERQTYVVEGADTNCTDCNVWTYKDQNIILESNPNEKEMTVKGALPGTAVLSFEMKSKSGKNKCAKTLTVMAPTTDLLPADSFKCDIAVANFEEVRISDKIVAFKPVTEETNLTYKWTAYYRGGEEKVLTSKIPQFDYSNGHVIDKIVMDVAQNKCTKKLTKNYDTNFWYFF